MPGGEDVATSPKSSGLLISMISTQGSSPPAPANLNIHSTPYPRSENRSKNTGYPLAPPSFAAVPPTVPNAVTATSRLLVTVSGLFRNPPVADSAIGHVTVGIPPSKRRPGSMVTPSPCRGSCAVRRLAPWVHGRVVDVAARNHSRPDAQSMAVSDAD